MTTVWKTCNCCLTRNAKPAQMTERAKVKWCRECRMKTVWAAASDEVMAEFLARRERTSALIAELLA